MSVVAIYRPKPPRLIQSPSYHHLLPSVIWLFEYCHSFRLITDISRIFHPILCYMLLF